MKRPTLNFLIDMVALAGFVLLTATGVLRYVVLPPGSGRLVGEGSGVHAGARPVTLLWGLTRHQWGEIHFWMALGLFLALALHLLLHWRWIAAMVQGKASEGAGVREALGLTGVVALLVLALAPFFTPPTQLPRSALQEQAEQGQQSLTPGASVRLRGAMTLAEVAQQTGIPVAELVTRLNLPPDTAPTARIGQLARAYGFTLAEAQRAVETYEQAGSISSE